MINKLNKNLIRQFKKSCLFITKKDEKNNFVRLREYFDNKSYIGITFHSLIIPVLNNELKIKECDIKLLKALSKIIRVILRENKIKIINTDNKRTYRNRNINQENRMRRNFIRFLKLTDKDIQRELSLLESNKLT